MRSLQVPSAPTRALLSGIRMPNPEAKRQRVILECHVTSPLNPPPGCLIDPLCRYMMLVRREGEPEVKECATGHLAACHSAS